MAALCVAIGASTAIASTVDCGTVSDVTTLTGSNNCQVPGSILFFSNFTVDPGAGLSAATIGIANDGPLGTNVSAGETNLVFQIGGLAGSGVATDNYDIQLFYEVTASLIGIDVDFSAIPITTGSMTIFETACSQAFVSGNCPVGAQAVGLQATSTGPSSPGIASAVIPWVGAVFIKKDIQFDGAATSEFTNSQAIPEPMTLSLIGAGLLGLGIFGRRRISK